MSRTKHTISHKRLKNHVLKHYDKDEAMMVYGPPGIGKSDLIKSASKDIAEKEGREFKEFNEMSDSEKQRLADNPDEFFVLFDIRLSQYDPSDIKGIPDLNSDRFVEWKVPDWVGHVSDSDAKGVIFFDEVNHATPSVLKSMYQVILDKQVASQSLSDGVFVIAAGNRQEDRAAVHEMPTPLRDRFSHVELEPPSGGKDGSWTQWALDNNLHESVIGFIGTPLGQDKLNTFNDRKESRVFSTPRSWEKVSDLIKDVDLDGDAYLDYVEDVVSMRCGRGVATEFRGMLEMQKQIDFERLVEEPGYVNEIQNGEGSTTDLMYSVITGLASKYGEDASVLEPLVKVAQEIDRPEFSILLMRLASSKRQKHFLKNAQKVDGAKEMLPKFKKYLM